MVKKSSPFSSGYILRQCRLTMLRTTYGLISSCDKAVTPRLARKYRLKQRSNATVGSSAGGHHGHTAEA